MGINTRSSITAGTQVDRFRSKIMRSRQSRSHQRRTRQSRAVHLLKDIIDSPYLQAFKSEDTKLSLYSSSSENTASSFNSGINPETYRIAGIPHPAVITNDNAPVHIDVGGTSYTTTLTTLTKYPSSKLAELFNGKIDITLDSLKNNYFIDRDGVAFRHILNFLRYNSLVLPNNYSELGILLSEAKFYELDELVNLIQQRIVSQS